MARIEPLPENIPLFDVRGITRRWMGWFRAVHNQVSSSIDADALSAFSTINRDTAVIEDETRLALFPSTEVPSSGVEDLEKLVSAGWNSYHADLAAIETRLSTIPTARAWSEISVIADTAANAGKYPAAAYVPGSYRFETDTEKLFLQIAGAWVQLIAPALLQFLGTSSSFPALKRSGTILQVRLADDSTYSALEVLDEAYGSGWNGKVEVPTKNAVYDQVELKADKQTPSGAPFALTLAKFTPGGSDGSITITAQGTISAFTAPT